MAHTLLLRHLSGTEPAIVEVQQASGKAAPRVEVPSPLGFAVEGRPGRDLFAELRWYLEEFLDYPFSPELEHAERVLAALHAWGEKAFQALFDNREGGRMFDAATAEGYEELVLQVWSDDPRVLGWPWEALRDPQKGALAPACRIERCLNRVRDPAPPRGELPKDRVNILLVIARPKEGDVKYRSVGRPLVELIEKRNLPAHVHVLRPPTFERLREHLKERAGYYHIVHFDGHGGYGQTRTGGGEPHAYEAPEGRLLFEDEKGNPYPVSADKLSTLLQEYRVPAMVLNACRSAMIDGRAEDPFASVAASLLKAGTRSVVAMSYSLYVSGAQQFLPAFYKELFERGNMAEAARAGRQQMFSERGRVCARGKFDLQDWLVPVVYQQGAVDLSFVSGVKVPPSIRYKLPKEALDGDNPYGLIGRDGALLAIERALRLPVPAILLHGLGGVGKTTLARGLIEWLAATEGLGKGCVWLSFQDIRSAEYVFNRLGEPLFGLNFAAEKLDRKIDMLAGALKENHLILVWDNFEVAAGFTGFPATLSEADRHLLKSFLQKLRGGLTKVLITSRSEEEWLGTELRRKIALGGLDGEERWSYCETIAENLGITIDRTDRDLVELMNLLGGHPLAMRVILPRLEKQRAGELVLALRSNLAALGEGGDEAQKKLYATLQLAEEVLPEELRPLLVVLGMHERYVDGDLLEPMAKQVDEGWTRARIDQFLGALANAGLLWNQGQAVYEMHPALTGFLRATSALRAAEESRDRWARGFVDVMGTLAHQLTPREWHEQRASFHWHSANFYHARIEAERLRMSQSQAALTQGLAIRALKVRNLSEAMSLYERFAKVLDDAGDKTGEAVAYHQLGRIAEEKRDFDTASTWYQKALMIKEKLGNELGTASTYHQLGMIAQEQRDFDAASAWYRRSLEIYEKFGNELGVATTYHQLGIVAQMQRNFDAASAWYRKALEIKEKLDNNHDVAITYHQLGIVAQEQRDFDAASAWYRKALEIKERLGYEYSAATTYHQLGRVAEEQRDFDAASVWYRKALAIFEKIGNKHSAAMSYGQLGAVSGRQGHFDDSGRWLVKAIIIFAKCRAPRDAQQAMFNFLLNYNQAPPADQLKLKSLWEAAGLGPFPPPDAPPTPPSAS